MDFVYDMVIEKTPLYNVLARLVCDYLRDYLYIDHKDYVDLYDEDGNYMVTRPTIDLETKNNSPWYQKFIQWFSRRSDNVDYWRKKLKSSIGSVCISPCSKYAYLAEYVATGNYGGYIVVWSIKEDQEIYRQKIDYARINELILLPERYLMSSAYLLAGSYLLAGTNSGQCVIWELYNNNRELKVIDRKVIQYRVEKMCINRTRDRIYASSKKNIKIVEVDSNMKITRILDDFDTEKWFVRMYCD